MCDNRVFRVRFDGRPWIDEPHNSLTAAVRSILALFTGWESMAWGMVIPSPDSGNSSVTLYRLSGATVHAVGNRDLALQLQALFPVDGWRLHPLPPEATPLEALYDRLGRRIYNLLRRGGFATAEEVAAVSDRGLLSLRGMGQDNLHIIRRVVRGPTCLDAASAMALDRQQMQELGMLLVALAAYAEHAGDDQVHTRALHLAALALDAAG